jgi:hypothetical protein
MLTPLYHIHDPQKQPKSHTLDPIIAASLGPKPRLGRNLCAVQHSAIPLHLTQLALASTAEPRRGARAGSWLLLVPLHPTQQAPLSTSKPHAAGGF